MSWGSSNGCRKQRHLDSLFYLVYFCIYNIQNIQSLFCKICFSMIFFFNLGSVQLHGHKWVSETWNVQGFQLNMHAVLRATLSRGNINFPIPKPSIHCRDSHRKTRQANLYIHKFTPCTGCCHISVFQEINLHYERGSTSNTNLLKISEENDFHDHFITKVIIWQKNGNFRFQGLILIKKLSNTDEPKCFCLPWSSLKDNMDLWINTNS